MQNIQRILSNLRRPGLLIRAAKHGVPLYDRRRTLAHLIDHASFASTDEVLSSLIDAEAEIEQHRRADSDAYSISKHIEILVALIVEAQHAAANGKT